MTYLCEHGLDIMHAIIYDSTQVTNTESTEVTCLGDFEALIYQEMLYLFVNIMRKSK